MDVLFSLTFNHASESGSVNVLESYTQMRHFSGHAATEVQHTFSTHHGIPSTNVQDKCITNSIWRPHFSIRKQQSLLLKSFDVLMFPPSPLFIPQQLTPSSADLCLWFLQPFVSVYWEPFWDLGKRRLVVLGECRDPKLSRVMLLPRCIRAVSTALRLQPSSGRFMSTAVDTQLQVQIKEGEAISEKIPILLYLEITEQLQFAMFPDRFRDEQWAQWSKNVENNLNEMFILDFNEEWISFWDRVNRIHQSFIVIWTNTFMKCLS